MGRVADLVQVMDEEKIFRDSLIKAAYAKSIYRQAEMRVPESRKEEFLKLVDEKMKIIKENELATAADSQGAIMLATMTPTPLLRERFEEIAKIVLELIYGADEELDKDGCI